MRKQELFPKQEKESPKHDTPILNTDPNALNRHTWLNLESDEDDGPSLHYANKELDPNWPFTSLGVPLNVKWDTLKNLRQALIRKYKNGPQTPHTLPNLRRVDAAFDEIKKRKRWK